MATVADAGARWTQRGTSDNVNGRRATSDTRTALWRALGPGDVVLMDFSMPRLGGAGCAAAIRCDPALDGVRIIGVTGNVL